MIQQDEINYWKKQFPILDNWEISYDNPINTVHIANASGQISLYKIAGKNVAYISKWEGEGEEPKDYIFHEIMHLVLHCIKNEEDVENARYNEEEVVQKLCELLYK